LRELRQGGGESVVGKVKEDYLRGENQCWGNALSLRITA